MQMTVTIGDGNNDKSPMIITMTMSEMYDDNVNNLSDFFQHDDCDDNDKKKLFDYYDSDDKFG